MLGHLPQAINQETLRRTALVAIAAAALALTLLAGLGRVPGGPVLLILTLGGLAAGWLILTRLENGLLMLPVVATVVPIAVGTGTSTSLVASLLLAVGLLGLWLAQMLVRQELTFLRSPVNGPLAGFISVVVLGLLSGNVLRDPLVWVPATWLQIQLGGLSLFVISAGLFWMAMNLLTSTALLSRLTWIMIGLGGATIMVFLATGRDLGFTAVGGLFSLWAVSLTTGQALFNQRLALWVRTALFGIVAAWLYRRVFVEFDWISGWLPIVLSLGIQCALRSWRLVVVGLIGLALVLSLNYDFFAYHYELQVSGDDSEGNYERFQVWTRALEVTEDQFLLGLGPVGNAVYYGTYYRDDARSSHSNYLDILVQTGLLGSICFVWFLGALFAVARRARHRWRAGFEAGYANGALGGLVGLTVAMALGDWFIPYVYNLTMSGFRVSLHSWLILGGLAALAHQRLDHHWTGLDSSQALHLSQSEGA